ncbi:MAG: DUF3791 domain-containing protein [Duncaniella sp.]|nr:DUF3791 domain-containing protein [Duncaniella sp.]
MDTKTLEFVTYCISKLASVLNMNQREVYRRLKQSGILYDYIVPSYDVLHTFGSRYLVEDLTDYMKEKGVLPTCNVVATNTLPRLSGRNIRV